MDSLEEELEIARQKLGSRSVDGNYKLILFWAQYAASRAEVLLQAERKIERNKLLEEKHRRETQI